MKTHMTTRWIVISALLWTACGDSSAKQSDETLVSALNAAQSKHLCESIFDSSVNQSLGFAFATCTLQGLRAASAGLNSCKTIQGTCLSAASSRVADEAPSSCRLERCAGLTVGDVKKCNAAYDEDSDQGLVFDCSSALKDVQAFLETDRPEACAAYFTKCGF